MRAHNARIVCGQKPCGYCYRLQTRRHIHAPGLLGAYSGMGAYCKYFVKQAGFCPIYGPGGPKSDRRLSGQIR